jgi:hypothetical protein
VDRDRNGGAGAGGGGGRDGRDRAADSEIRARVNSWLGWRYTRSEIPAGSRENILTTSTSFTLQFRPNGEVQAVGSNCLLQIIIIYQIIYWASEWTAHNQIISESACHKLLAIMLDLAAL